jgi:hypothetical protein
VARALSPRKGSVVANRKPPSEVDRMPLDFEQPRKQQTAPDDAGAVLTLTPLSDAERVARTGRALAVLASYDADDLAPMLGLTDLPETGPNVSGPINVTCPQCRVPAGNRCVSMSSGDAIGHHHVARQRRAAQAKGAAA